MIIDWEAIKMLPGVSPSAPLGRAYAHWRQVRLEVKALQDEVNMLRDLDQEDLRSFRQALYGNRDPRGNMAAIDERRERIAALKERMRPLRAEMHSAEERLDSLWSQWYQAKSAVDAIRELGG